MEVAGFAPAVDSVAHKQISLPVRLGGIGLRPYSRTAPAAYVASFMQATRCISAQPATQQQQHVAASLVDLRRHPALPPLTPASLADLFARGPVPQQQRVWTHAIEDSMVVAMKDDSKVAFIDRTRLAACSAKSGNHWLVTVPSCRAFQLSNSQMRAALRHRLGIKPADDIDLARCPLCNDRDVTPCHFHACKQLRGGAVTHRHDDVLAALGLIVRAARGHFWPEPKVWLAGEDDHGIRPDAIIYSRSLLRTMVDVSVVTSTCKSYTKGKRTVKANVSKRESDKKGKYRQLAASEDCEFKAVVFDSYGTVGDETRELLHQLAESHTEDPDKETEFYLHALRSLSFALQAGNAHVSAVGCERVRAARPALRH